ncbi:restriction endonuclease [Confluentibacter citreus]|uniref:restriction endonuclease n=1 Tax=Confluentibacter citreus TaxID=2007307 RepID=UPI000C28E893|nr:restriction endonuclease [Confluentibacter citreus]
MKVDIPKYNETFNPILEILKEEGVIHRRELIRKVVDNHYSHLPTELLEQRIKSGDILIHNRIAWGISYLKQSEFVEYPKRGFVQIAPKGIKHAGVLLLKDVQLEISKLNVYDAKNVPQQENQTSSPEDLIDQGFLEIEREVKNELLEKLKTIDPYYFEKVILILLKKMGYGDFIETSKSSDGGIDGIINEDKLGLDRIYIQAKRFTENKVREKDIRNFIGAMSGDTNKGVFVTTSIFDKGAEEKAKNAHHKIILIDGFKLVDLMHEYNVGIQIKSIYEVKHLDEDFFVEQ